MKSKKQKRPIKGRTKHRREPKEGNVKLNNLGSARKKLNVQNFLLHVFNPQATNVIYIYGAPSKARNANVAYIWTYVWQR